MLYRLEIENFYSIRDHQDIDLRAAGNAPAESDRLAEIWPGASERAAKTVAIYGANASGKSTVLKALSFITQFVMHSFSAPAHQRIMYDRFNDDEAFSQPTRLSIELSGVSDITRLDDPSAFQCRYRYELVIGGPRSEPAHVESEALYYWPLPDRRRTQLFRRHRDGRVKAAKDFGLSGFKPALEKVLRPNASIISTLVQLKHPFAGLIWNTAARVSSNIFIERSEAADGDIARHYASNHEQLALLNREISRIDLGIKEVHVFPADNGPTIQFSHEGLTALMPLHLESHGTRSFLKLYPLIAQVLAFGGIAIIDELDSSIHPSILPEILGWFHDSDRNPYNAQLWITCHNAALLDFLTKEEVFFCEKDSQGRTSVYSLKDVQGVRREDNFYRKYLSGVYGAVPQIG
ncbi:MAG: ATP-binding protein [Alphaproteobacteria bacterium]|nr:ATP-binding protein [Alphaproteobacteria bacterium]MBU1560089.1 ATP-binding protein [Alphaproteobacteria bacterium]MBU2303251.1 ATP-binding protein [Alphaproteobacteria bacterium]MBU2366138.1 ATP-binding protein [Alphaproteobacteria bacterium]